MAVIDLEQYEFSMKFECKMAPFSGHFYDRFQPWCGDVSLFFSQIRFQFWQNISKLCSDLVGVPSWVICGFFLLV